MANSIQLGEGKKCSSFPAAARPGSWSANLQVSSAPGEQEVDRSPGEDFNNQTFFMRLQVQAVLPYFKQKTPTKQRKGSSEAVKVIEFISSLPD